MKNKIILILVMILTASIIFAGCSRNPQNQLSYYYQYAMVRMPDGSCVGGPIESYTTYSNGIISVKIDGVIYRTHSVNVVLTAKGN